MGEQPTVFVIDDDKAVREGIVDLVRAMDLQVQAFARAEEFLEANTVGQPGCLVLDVRMPGMSGLSLQRRLAEQDIRIPIIIITGHGDVPMAVEAMKDGAIDFIEKPFREQVLWDSITRALERAERRRCQRAAAEAFEEKATLLTDREREVMEFLVGGKADKEIAQKLGISTRAIAFHRVHIFEKLAVESTVELARVHCYATQQPSASD
jgi:FixJ family two-component response regulator